MPVEDYSEYEHESSSQSSELDATETKKEPESNLLQPEPQTDEIDKNKKASSAAPSSFERPKKTIKFVSSPYNPQPTNAPYSVQQPQPTSVPPSVQQPCEPSQEGPFNSYMPAIDISLLLENAMPVVLTLEKLKFLVEKSPLLTESQRLRIFSTLNQYIYQPLLVPEPTLAAERNAVFGILQTSRDGVVGLFCLMFLRDSSRCLTFFVPAKYIPSVKTVPPPPAPPKLTVNKIILPKVTSVGATPPMPANAAGDLKVNIFPPGPRSTTQFSIGDEYRQTQTVKISQPLAKVPKAMSISSVVASPSHSLVETKNVVTGTSGSGANTFNSAVETLEKEEMVIMNVKTPQSGQMELQGKINPRQMARGTTFIDKNVLLEKAMNSVQAAKKSASQLVTPMLQNTSSSSLSLTLEPLGQTSNADESKTTAEPKPEISGINRIMDEMIALRRENEFLKQQVKLLTIQQNKVSNQQNNVPSQQNKVTTQQNKVSSQQSNVAVKTPTPSLPQKERAITRESIPIVSKPKRLSDLKHTGPILKDNGIAAIDMTESNGLLFNCKWKTCRLKDEGFDSRAELWKHVYTSHIHQH